jgi:ABC-type uncharacterized transport system fused permease/ATPase subunit
MRGHSVAAPEAGRISFRRVNAQEHDNDFGARTGEVGRRGTRREAISVAELLAQRGGFLGEQGPRASWALSGILLLIVLESLAASYGMNTSHRVIFDALQKRDSHTVLLLSLLYVPLLAGSVFLTIVQLWARMTIQRRWREWLNNHFINRGLKNGRYYQLDVLGGPSRTRNIALLTTCENRDRGTD